MAYYNVCPNCGSNLDPGERCDCEDEKIIKLKSRANYFNQHLVSGKRSQMEFSFDEAKGVDGT